MANNYPFVGNAQTFLNDFAINNQNPGMEYGGTETGALYYEDREINGAMYRVQNATYNKIAGAWVLINPALPAYGQALLPNGTTEFLSSPAGTSPITSWTVVYSTTNAGVSTISPIVSTIPSGADMSGLGIFNVKHYGAKGDGITDDAAAIQSAINACSAASGGIVYLPSATYIVSAPLNVPSPMIISGCGMFSSTIQVAVSGYANFNGKGIIQPANTTTATDVSIFDLTLDGNSRNAPSSYHVSGSAYVSGILVLDRWLVQRVRIYDRNSYAINVGQARAGAVNDVKILDCQFWLGGYQDGIGGGWNSQNIQIARCRWDASYFSTTSLIDFTNALNVMIDDCVFESTTVLAVIMEAVFGGHVRGCQFLKGSSLIIQSDHLYNEPTITCPRDFVVSSNYLEGGGVVQTAGALIVVNHFGGDFASGKTTNLGRGIIITGNTINTPYGAGILWQCDDATSTSGGHIIAENFIINANAAGSTTANTGFAVVNPSGINVTGSAGMVIANNNITDSTGSPKQRYALQIGRTDASQTIGPMNVIGNMLLNAVTAAYNNTNTNGTPLLHNNAGANPYGHLNAPGVPTSTTPLQNTTGVDALIYVTTSAGVTVSAISLGATTGTMVATGLTMAASSTSSGITVPAGAYISLAYSGGTPGWTWFGD
jgi:hypothetical protein